MATSAQETPSFQSVFETDSTRPALTESRSYERLHLDEGKLADKSDSAVLSDAESSCSKKTSMSSPPGFSQPQPQQQRPASLSQKSVSSMSQSSTHSNNSNSDVFSKETSNQASASKPSQNAGIIAPMPKFDASTKPKSPGPVAKPVGSSGGSKKASVTNTDGSTAVFCDFSKQMHTNKSDSERCHRNIFYQKINSLGLKIARLDMGKRGAKHAFLHLYDCDMQQQLLVRGHLHIESIDCTVRFY
jgi:hypothetical protein